MKKTILCLTMTLAILVGFAQPGLQWASGFNGGLARGVAVFADPQGNVYSCGDFQGQVDFDPGSSSLTYTALQNNPDGFVTKQDGVGNLLWAKQVAGASILATDVVADKWGYTYVTGYFNNVADFDPGAGTYTLSSTTVNYSDPYVLKLSPAGDFVWVKQFRSGNGIGAAITCDSLSNVIVTGYHQGIVDFDPGPGTFTLQCAGNNDAYLCKLDSAGNLVWASNFGGNYFQAYGNDVILDSAGSIYLGATFRGSIDIDPATTVYTIASTSSTVYNCAVAKFSKNGSFKWAKVMGGENIDLSRDGFGNIYCSGTYAGTADFDPGPSAATFTSAGARDIYMVKLDSTGNHLWSRTIGSQFGDYCSGLGARRSGGMVLGGTFIVNLDFDPGPAVYTMTSAAGTPFILQLDASGNFDWAVPFMGPYNGIYTGGGTVADVFVDPGANIYATGLFIYTVDFDPGAGTYTLAALNNDDPYVVKLCTGAPPLAGISGATMVCSGTPAVFSASPLYSGGTFTWSVPSGWTTTTTINGILANVAQSGLITLSAGNSCGASPSKTLFVSASASPTVSVTPPLSLCAGDSWTLSANGASSYSWNSGAATASLAVTPLSNTAYTVTGTTGSCATSATTAVTVLSNPTVSVAGNAPVCAGSTLSLLASGAGTYSWSTGSQGPAITVVPTASTNVFTVTGTDTSGCKAVTAVTVTVLASPSVSIAASASTLCAGGSASLSVSGAHYYTWSTGDTAATILLTPPATTIVTATGSFSNGCQSSAFTAVTVHALPGLTLTGDSVLCRGQGGTLVAQGAATYSWSTGATGSVLPVQPAADMTLTMTGTSDAGCTSQLDFTVHVVECLGLHSVGTNLPKIYPNPTRGAFVIEARGGLTLRVYNAGGALVHTQAMKEGKAHADIQGFSKGLYFVVVQTDSGSTERAKLIVE